ncbi:DUF802 domain-containing protein [Aquabacterium humicola]|uniref:DUF802 domain-containing protein n=1 Tax=Aquabacterium humicola TaxID=3237377 RepID=UPI0025430F84|nr:DUF802 domain-containing protein [Rubrivivax pictus]
MMRTLQLAAFAAGLALIGWVGAAYVGTNALALAVTAVVGAFFVAGGLELLRFQRVTAQLATAVDALQAPPADLPAWLATLPAPLRQAVRMRIDGERAALPGPALAPSLTGLLVLLGMLGTFLGMVVTLNGTGLALQGATDLAAIRASLSAPVQGLGLAFGTSIAGVMASAMLGLMLALGRRERGLVAHRLDAAIATTLRGFTPAFRREQAFVQVSALLQRQAEAMPALVDRLQAMMATIEQQQGRLGEQLVAGQERFHGQAEAAYGALAASVDRSLKTSLADSARLAGEAMAPIAESALAGIARETRALQAGLAQGAQAQLDALSSRFDATLQAQSERWQRLLDEQRDRQAAQARDARTAIEQTAAAFEQHAAALLRGIADAQSALQAQAAVADEQRLAAWTGSLQAIAGSLQQDAQAAGERAAQREQQILSTLQQTAQALSAQAEAHAQATIAELSRLVQAASEAPRIAAEVIAELRQKLSDSMARDNTMLEERGRLLDTLAQLLDAVNHASGEQRAAIDALVATAAELLQRAGDRFAEQVDAEAGRIAGIAAQITGSAVEVASLGEVFGQSVQLFGHANDKLVAQLQRIEGTLSKSIARSDEQLAYYVAQAREVVDLSILSQQQIVEDLQRVAAQRGAAVPSEA